MKRVPAVLAAVLVQATTSAFAQVPAGPPEFRLNTHTTGSSASNNGRTVAVAPNGDFVVAWQQRAGSVSTLYEIYGRRYDAAGAPRGAGFTVSTFTGNHQLAPTVAATRNGFIVVWVTGAGPGQLGGIIGRRFGSDGAPVGAEFRPSVPGAGVQGTPAIAAHPSGSFVVVWTSSPQDGSDSGIFGHHFDASGAKQGGEFQVNSYTTGAQSAPAIAMDDAGHYVVVWGSPQDGSDLGVYGQRFDRTGARLGGEFRVHTSTIARQHRPSIAASSGGDFIVAWTSVPAGVGDATYAQRFDAAGTPQGAEFRTSTNPISDWGPSVSADEVGNFAISWVSPRQPPGSTTICGERFDRHGVRRGGEFCATTTLGVQMGSVASDASGNLVLTWTAPDGDAYGVFGQRYGVLRPAALAVDPADLDGNGVLDPGEAATVRPSWRNLNGASQTFSSVAAAFTGPPGATYAVTDGAADYGTVPDAATASCQAAVNCFVVSVAGPRPATHWDAKLEENIRPDVQGQVKVWTLHVGGSFTDVTAASPFYRFVETMLHRAVTGGCTANAYCPGSSTTREQMAVFALVSKEGAGYAPPACATTTTFADVPATSPFCRWIEELARRGVVTGCGGGNYCPSAVVSREQMSIFALKTLEGAAYVPPACGAPIYSDVPASSPFCRYVEELTRRGVVTGCGGGAYCPQDPVTREQMSVFLTVTFALTLYGV